jgi:hypothetical protein
VEILERELNRFGAPTFEACATQGRGVKETLKGVALLVLRHLADKYGGGGETTPSQIFAPGRPEAPDAIRATGTGPLEVEDLGAGEMLEEIEEYPETEAGGLPVPGPGAHASSVVEVPVVLDRSLFSGESPVEIRLKLYLK